MPSNANISLILTLALVGCGGARGYDDVPTIALPPTAGMAAGASARYDPPPPPGRAYPPRLADPLPPSQGLPPGAPQGAGPRGTSGEVREDVVGYATPMRMPPDARFAGVAIGVGHPTLPLGGFVELTALDTGRTIVAMIVAPDDDGSVVALSPGAAQALGADARAAVRVRTIIVTPQDQVALRSGEAGAPRLDAPPALLAALRRKLPAQRGTGRAPPARMSPVRTDRPVRPDPAPRVAGGGYVVQVAALSSAPRAQALAQRLGGHVVPGGGLYRVQIGPFADAASAQRARDAAARQGYADARIIHTD